MKTAGGFIALIAGVWSIFLAGLTLMFSIIINGGISSALEGEGSAGMVVLFGWGGVVFSFLTIILGAVAIGVSSKWPGILLIVCSIAGAILGGTLAALFMVLAFVGGVLALLGARKQRPLPASDVETR